MSPLIAALDMGWISIIITSTNGRGVFIMSLVVVFESKSAVVIECPRPFPCYWDTEVTSWLSSPPHLSSCQRYEVVEFFLVFKSCLIVSYFIHFSTAVSIEIDTVTVIDIGAMFLLFLACFCFERCVCVMDLGPLFDVSGEMTLVHLPLRRIIWRSVIYLHSFQI